MATKVCWERAMLPSDVVMPPSSFGSRQLSAIVEKWMLHCGFRIIEMTESPQFRRVLPPRTWSIRANDNGYHLFDEQMRRRAHIELHLVNGVSEIKLIRPFTRYWVTINDIYRRENLFCADVINVDKTIFQTKPMIQAYMVEDKVRAERTSLLRASNWLTRAYPAWQNPEAYW